MSFEHSVYLSELTRTCLVAATRYLDKIKSINVDPYTLADSTFEFGLDAVPPVSNMDIVSYLVLTQSYYTKEQMKAYKSLTAYKYFQAGFVEKVGVKEVNNYMLLVAKVQHSMRAREPKLKVWIITEKDGGVCTAHCTCMAGLGEVCSHVAAVLYATEYAANLKMSISCTDIKSTWPVPSQSGLQPTPAASMDWGKVIDPKINIDVPPIDNNELCSMLQDIETNGEAAALMRIIEPLASKIEKENSENTILPLFFNIYDKKLERCDLTTLINIGKNMDTSLSGEMITKIEENTQAQRKSTEWYRQRTGRITASVFKNVCRTSVEKPSISLIKNICYPVKNKVFSKAISWGMEHEDVAVDCYYQNMQTKHENFQVNKEEEDDDYLVMLSVRENMDKPPRIQSYIRTVVQNYTDGQFQSHFRVTADTFNRLCQLLAPKLMNNFPNGRPTCDPIKQLLAVLWLLATPYSYRSVSDRFDISKSTLHHSFIRVIHLLNQLAPAVIAWPKDNTALEAKRGFSSSGLNNIIGAIDGSYIKIRTPTLNPNVYICRKKFHAITLQAICTPNLKITDAFVGYPSSVHDSRIFLNSDIYKNITNNVEEYFPNGEYIIGDKAYPIRNWLITPYFNRGILTERQHHFNFTLSSVRQTVERTFALLKGRFRRLKYLDMKRVDLIPATVLASAVLHNICLEYDDQHIQNYIEEGMEHNNVEEGEVVDQFFHEDEAGLLRRDRIALNL